MIQVCEMTSTTRLPTELCNYEQISANAAHNPPYVL